MGIFVFLLLICNSSLFILDTGLLLDIWFAHILSCVMSPLSLSFLKKLWLYLQHTEVPRPGINTEPQLWLEPQQWQHWILNPLSKQGTPFFFFLLSWWCLLKHNTFLYLKSSLSVFSFWLLVLFMSMSKKPLLNLSYKISSCVYSEEF